MEGKRNNSRRRCRSSGCHLSAFFLFSSIHVSSLTSHAAVAFVTHVSLGTTPRNTRKSLLPTSRLRYENGNRFGWNGRNSNSTTMSDDSSGTELSVGASFSSWDLTSWDLYNQAIPNDYDYGQSRNGVGVGVDDQKNNDDYCHNAQVKASAVGTSRTNANTNTNSNANSNANTNTNTNIPVQKYKIYCDMDGCLVNFEKGVRRLLKQRSSDIDKRQMWEGISRSPLWFETLEWQMDGKRLWRAIRDLRPDILTGVPGDVFSSRVEKFNWCKRELRIDERDAHHVDMAADQNWEHHSVNGNLPREDKTNIITCWSSNKHKECNRHGSILIDDRIDLKQDWEDAGGIFIHHVNTEATIRKLRDLGVISEDQLEKEDEGWYCGEGSWNFWD